MGKVQSVLKHFIFCLFVLLYLPSCHDQKSFFQSNFLLNNGDTIISIKKIKDSLNLVIYDYRFHDWAGLTEPRSFFFNFKKGKLVVSDNSAYLDVSEPQYKKMTVELFDFNLKESSTKNAKIHKASDIRYDVPDYKIMLLDKIDTNETDTNYLFKLKNFCFSKNIDINFWFSKQSGITGIFYTFNANGKDYYYSGVGNCRYKTLKKCGIVFESMNNFMYEF